MFLLDTDTVIFGLKGTRVDDFDLLIASFALAHNLTLISNNTKHFGRIPGLRLENWTN